MEWFRDLSIIILALVTTVVLIFTTILLYRLYRTLKTTLALIKEASQIAHDTVSMLQECIKPLLPVLMLIKGISGGFQSIFNLFTKQK